MTFSMYDFFLGEIPCFPGEWEQCNNTSSPDITVQVYVKERAVRGPQRTHRGRHERDGTRDPIVSLFSIREQFGTTAWQP